MCVFVCSLRWQLDKLIIRQIQPLKTTKCCVWKEILRKVCELIVGEVEHVDFELGLYTLRNKGISLNAPE